MSPPIFHLDVSVASSSYPILIGEAMDWQSCLSELTQNRQVMVVTNVTVSPLYLQKLKTALSSVQKLAVFELPDGESFKNSESYLSILDELMTSGFNRDCVVIALGGGVVGDMAGFAAATFQRGVDFIQIPTTLLAQVDSSVGGKTGINHPLGKNMIGAFKQPKLVLIDIQTLNTLPERELSAGISEVIKYAAIADRDFFDWLEIHLDSIMALDATKISETIYRCCQHKAQIVAEDEFEQGRRALLNFGHTFGHAIENHQGYGKWLHGEAVGAGMVQAADLSHRLGWLELSDLERLKTLIQRSGLPVLSPILKPELALKLMQRDKKVKNGQIRLILLRSLGEAILTKGYSADALLETLEQTSGAES